MNYEFRAPEPFTQDVHEDLLADLARISQQSYASDLDLHIDLSRTLKRLNDGHCVYLNSCYDSKSSFFRNVTCETHVVLLITALFITYLPTPLVLLTNADGTQDVHIAPEAFAVASVEFADEIDFWQNSLPGPLKGQLSSVCNIASQCIALPDDIFISYPERRCWLSTVKILLLPSMQTLLSLVAFKALGLVKTRESSGFEIHSKFSSSGFSRCFSFFSSYNLGLTGWVYVFGDFAQTSLPLKDSANLTVQRVNTSETETFTVIQFFYSKMIHV